MFGQPHVINNSFSTFKQKYQSCLGCYLVLKLYLWWYLVKVTASPAISEDIKHILIVGSANSHSYFVSRFRDQQCRVAQPAGALELGCEEMEREWGNQEEMERDWGNGKRFTLYISSFSLYFLPLYPFPKSKFVTFCRKMLNTAVLSQMSQKT